MSKLSSHVFEAAMNADTSNSFCGLLSQIPPWLLFDCPLLSSVASSTEPSHPLGVMANMPDLPVAAPSLNSRSAQRDPPPQAAVFISSATPATIPSTTVNASSTGVAPSLKMPAVSSLRHVALACHLTRAHNTYHIQIPLSPLFSVLSLPIMFCLPSTFLQPPNASRARRSRQYVLQHPPIHYRKCLTKRNQVPPSISPSWGQ